MPKTIKEIAHDTGYSRTTVTLVINGKADNYRISPKAKAAIEAYIAKHGYRYNQAARSLKLARSHTIGLIVPDIGNAFFARVAAALERRCRQEGFVLVTTSTGEDPAIERLALENFAARGVDGVVLTPSEPRRRLPAGSRKGELPTVQFDRYYEGDGGFVVTSHHFASAELLTERVLEAGATDIAFLTGSPSNPTTLQRIKGFESITADHRRARTMFHVCSSDMDTEEGGHGLMMDFLDNHHRLPQGLLFGSLLIFHGAMRAIRTRLGSIPTTLIVGTFAESNIIEYLPNPVFVVRQNESELAEQAFRTLAQLMRKETPEEHVHFVATDLVQYRL
ncbi:substrate-binding domain-containing protein [Pelagibacterium limicola]|uniref:substrate-binding domain-containing protein n=1 Tax=Pelagibacterium limicola TaxID=2791022 RepID=UPI0018AF8E6B|nr:substrate-binding domain-containing protein [Pelagibacterium limicola]